MGEGGGIKSGQSGRIQWEVLEEEGQKCLLSSSQAVEAEAGHRAPARDSPQESSWEETESEFI